MKKNFKLKTLGFTLVELIGVIIILCVIALITFPIVDKTIKNSKEKALEQTINNIEKAAYEYSIQNDIGYETYYKPLSLETLTSAGVLKGNIINPVTDKEMQGCVLYKWVEEYKQYEFKYDEECDIVVVITTGPIKDVVLSNFPYLETNGNGCVTSTSNNYSYMGGCYLKGNSQSGKDMFYSIMNQTGMDNNTITQTFFDNEENFKLQEFETWYRNFVKQQGTTDEEIDQMLQDSGVSTIFELLTIGITGNPMKPEELFAQKGLNNSLWYSGFLWKIMGINADGTVRLITDENVTAIPWGASGTDQNWDESYAKDWLNNYFYPRLKGNNIIKEEIWCSEITTDKNSKRINCTNNLSKEKSKVGLLTLDEYNLAGSSSSYLNILQFQWTMTPSSSSLVWYMFYDGSISASSVSRTYGLRAVINVNPNTTITSGNGTLGENWSSEIGPYILNEDKSIDITGKLNEKATSGEYVMFAGKKYRVVDKDSNGNTKLILDGYYEENESIFEMEYGNGNTFSTTTGIGQKLNGDVLNWLTNNNETEKGKLVSNYTWYQNNFDNGYDYKISLNEENPTRSIQATVGLIRVGEMLSSQSSSILTKGYTTMGSYNNTNSYWTMTPYTSSSRTWFIFNYGYAFDSSSSAYSLRAVIVVNSDVNIISGNGTWSSPYQI